MSDDFDNALDAHASTAQPESGDPFGAALEARAAAAPDVAQSPSAPKSLGVLDPEVGPVVEFLRSSASGMGQNISASAHLAKAVSEGKIHSLSDARRFVDNFKKANPAYQPESEAGKAVTEAAGSNFNPMNWPGLATYWAGRGVTKALDVAGVPSQYSTAIGPGVTAAADIGIGAYGATKALGLGERAPAIAAAERVEPTMGPKPSFEPEPIQGTKLSVDTEPVEGGVPESAMQSRAQILHRVGITQARQSALSGNAMDAATDFQLSRFDEPAGAAAKAQFDMERQALANHAEGIVKKTGGTIGTDQDTLNMRGQTVSAPFDALRDYFDEQHAANYKAADAKSAGAPVGKLEGVETLLKDPDFTEALLAKDQGGLLGSLQRQFERFQKLNPEGFTVESAEKFRKFMNQVWTPQNSATIGKIKAALDDDVLKGAGEDIYGPARALAQTEHQIFNPKGIAKITDFDPNNPLNRATSFDKIPDTIARLPPAQFDNVIRTLHTLPEELQPQAQAAIAEIKSHLVNKILDAGQGTQGQWNAPGVAKVIKANSANLQSAFADQPEILQQIKDLDSAGRILKANQSYPGAAAQAANALKRGLLTKAITRGASSVGGAVGSVAGPLGAAGGAALGEAAGARLGASMGERAALKIWNNRVMTLSELMKQNGAPPTQ